MGQRLREDFCKIRPAAGHGSARYSSGLFRAYCTQDESCEVTKAEWKHILEPMGIFELCPPENELTETGDES